MPTKTKTITLVLTQSCNLNCVYCYEGNKDGKTMSFETAKAILDKELPEEGYDSYQVDLFGGEPLLRFPLLKQIVEYGLEHYTNKNIRYVTTTNGVLCKGEIKQWLEDHKDIITVCLSLDGTPEMHNMNRCNSYPLIDVDFFHRNWPDTPTKMTISPLTLPYIAKGIIHMHEMGYPFSCNLACDVDWSKKELKDLLYRELMTLIDYYLAHPDVAPAQIFQFNLPRVASRPKGDAQVRTCGSGVEMCCYSSDGERYPCQFFTPLSIGEEKSKAARAIKFKDWVCVDDYPSPCRECPALCICPNCFGANFSATGNIYQKDMNLCILNKTLFKAAAYLFIEKYKRGQAKTDPDLIPQSLKGAEIILTELD
ncbi:MAG: 4Fe-4S cluster-binding domain-containing protein [Bacilli bacterium]|nr:4Fe-4S cluster-binding domain-containing protein [Bacilli bacterium]